MAAGRREKGAAPMSNAFTVGFCLGGMVMCIVGFLREVYVRSLYESRKP